MVAGSMRPLWTMSGPWGQCWPSLLPSCPIGWCTSRYCKIKTFIENENIYENIYWKWKHLLKMKTFIENENIYWKWKHLLKMKTFIENENIYAGLLCFPLALLAGVFPCTVKWKHLFIANFLNNRDKFYSQLTLYCLNYFFHRFSDIA